MDCRGASTPKHHSDDTQNPGHHKQQRAWLWNRRGCLDRRNRRCSHRYAGRGADGNPRGHNRHGAVRRDGAHRRSSSNTRGTGHKRHRAGDVSNRGNIVRKDCWWNQECIQAGRDKGNRYGILWKIFATQHAEALQHFLRTKSGWPQPVYGCAGANHVRPGDTKVPGCMNDVFPGQHGTFRQTLLVLPYPTCTVRTSGQCLNAAGTYRDHHTG